jgi:predicted RNase H-like nuclease
LFEIHPELAFLRLAGGPLECSKKTPQGLARRAALVASGVGWDDGRVTRLVTATRGPGVAADDVLDAVAVACSARCIGTGEGMVLGDGARDERGLLMRICY